MEHFQEKVRSEAGPNVFGAGNTRVLRGMLQELHRHHALPPSSLARILHVDQGWVAKTLRELRKQKTTK
ncbi:MAG: hypothetical protein PHW74_14585 [Desulfobacca sp.]|nr:hypothetical protein [Desulfobacca sp.]